MTEPRDPDPRPDRRTEDDVRRLLADAVSDVDPPDALGAIRNRTKVTAMSARRPWLFAVGGAVVATAAVVTAIAFAGGALTGTAADPDPAGRTSPAPTSTAPASTAPTTAAPTSTAPAGPEASEEVPPVEVEPSASPSSTAASGSAGPVPVYLVSGTPQGLRLFREFQPASGGDRLLEAAVRTVEGRSLDPDYRSLWPAGSTVTSVTSDGAQVLTVDVTGAPHDRPSGMSAAQAQLALQQVVYSVQAAHGQGRVGVQLSLDGARSDRILGQPTSEPLGNAPVSETLSMMNISSPSEGATVAGRFRATGVNNSFEANVVWQVLDGDEVVAEGFGTAAGWGEEKLFPWTVEVDVSDLRPGSYTFRALNDDPSGGTEGAGPHTDDRVIMVE